MYPVFIYNVAAINSCSLTSLVFFFSSQIENLFKKKNKQTKK